MKVISLSLFGDPSSLEFGFYLRGIYYNARMNRILYPEFKTWVNVQSDLALVDFLDDLMYAGLIHVFKTHKPAPRCTSMLWRMYPIFGNAPHYFKEEITHVICRDADSVSTYREAMCVYDWLNSPYEFHAINDNQAHSGLMGGLVGFNTAKFKELTGYTSFDQMVSGYDFSKHGSDQNWMNKFVHPKIKHRLLFHNLKGNGAEAAQVKTEVPHLGEVNKKLWVTDLISRYIGSAGVIDMELLRFFRDFDPNPQFDEFEKKYKNIFYWRQ